MNPQPPEDDTAGSRLVRVQHRIQEACRLAGRPADAVRLLAVSKTWGADRVLELATLGQQAFAENYLQEALDKIDACAGRSLEWHFIGPIQSNKTRPIAENFHWVHSVERDKIARRLSDQRPPDVAPLQVCVQVNVSGEASKSGCDPDEAADLARLIVELPRLELRGLMAIPEPTNDAALQRARFGALRALHQDIRSTLDQLAGPETAASFDTLSMGMSDDLEVAVQEGATLVRIGTALFGRRQTSDVRPLP